MVSPYDLTPCTAMYMHADPLEDLRECEELLLTGSINDTSPPRPVLGVGALLSSLQQAPSIPGPAGGFVGPRQRA
jgi:hypothetical protein